ncbi:MAG: threonine--tRNA ligase [Candidatus Pacebacteria bacterium]|nr:threonine--tRNA ligase [Candidatus Paceibacterota bacterium]
MPVFTLPDGSERQFDQSVSGYDIAAAIGAGLAKAALAVKVDGRVSDLHLPLSANARIEIITAKSAEALELLRHDAAHVMAEAVQELYPDTQVTFGPATETGFYYDFARATPFSTDDLAAIEQRMHEIVERDEKIIREEWDRPTAIQYFADHGEKYKAEWIPEIPGNEPLTIYRQGKWLDLCRGPHLPSTGRLGHAFKLLKVAGAYWRGDANNAQLQRISGTAFATKEQLDQYLYQVEEAEKRDHRKIGKELDLFHLQEEAPGQIFWHPKGWVIYRLLETLIRSRLQPAGYDEVRTPQLIDQSLFKASGHWDMYGDNMFKVVTDRNEQGERLAGIKPMNCPGHVQIFRQGIKSYRDLPIRYAEFGSCHRNEPSGALHGILRVRGFTQDDAHIFCTEEQVVSECSAYIKLQLGVYATLGFTDIEVKLALRPDKRAGTDEVWDRAEQGLRDALNNAGLPFVELANEGAFYGPKIEFHLRDAIGRTWQCGTLQMDFVLPERLDASYIGEDGQKHRPVMLHRAILGSLERFVGVLIEHHAGKFPFWLAPVQVVVAPITNETDDYVAQVLADLTQGGVRAIADSRNEKINLKIREHSLAKIPVILVVGKREAEQGTVAIRRLGEEAQQQLPLAEAIKQLSRDSAIPN